jgi:hypothetical protein
VTISADMPSPVHAIECPSGHELSTTTNANTAQVQVPTHGHIPHARTHRTHAPHTLT